MIDALVFWKVQLDSVVFGYVENGLRIAAAGAFYRHCSIIHQFLNCFEDRSFSGALNL